MSATLATFLGREVRKAYGAVSTPVKIVDFILNACSIDRWESLDILEPGCGFCDFLSRIEHRYSHNKFTGIEVNPQVYREAALLFPGFNIIQSDFLLWESPDEYDVVIGNPPYGIIGDKKHYPIHVLKENKSRYRKVTSTWFGKYNIFAAFIEKGIRVLKNGGRLAFIIPATFMILDDFKYLRKFLAEAGRLKIYYLGPKMFKEISVSTIVLVVLKGAQGIEIYNAEGLQDNKLIASSETYDGGLIRFESETTRNFAEGCPTLGDYFNFRFAARSPEIRRHPLVSQEMKKGFVPVLTGRNLHRGWIDYEHCYSGLWMPKESAASLRDFYHDAHIVVGHTKGGKLMAAIDERGYPWREDIHLIPRHAGIDLHEVTNYLNSEEVQEYMRELYLDITPHITITQLKIVPVRGMENVRSEKSLRLI